MTSGLCDEPQSVSFFDCRGQVQERASEGSVLDGCSCQVIPADLPHGQLVACRGSAKGQDVPEEVATAAPDKAQLDAYAQKQWEVTFLYCQLKHTVPLVAAAQG